MGSIQRLPVALINQIAAGEVIERPASVVKELVENALDAGATFIQVQVKDGGRWIRVADNGSGMSPDDLPLAFENHATSKLSTPEDLFAIGTLGFRGEALASIAAIAKVTCQSRQKDMALGLKATISAQGAVTVQEAGCDYGTSFEVADLFYNVPARLKFLKRDKTELSHIHEWVQQLALSQPGVRFELILENQPSVKTSGRGDLKQTLMEVFDLDRPELLLPVRFKDDLSGFELTGLTSTPDCYRSSRKWLHTMLNGRVIQSPILNKAIESAYEGLITPGKYPVAVLNLVLPPAEVDVNVHPTKRDVRFAQPNTLYSFVRAGIQSALSVLHSPALQPTYSKPSPTGGPQRTMASDTEPSGGLGSGGVPLKALIPNTPISPITSKPYGQYRPLTEPQAEPNSTPDVLPKTAHSTSTPLQPSTGEVVHQQPLLSHPTTPQTTTDYRIIGQLAQTYILLETTEGLIIVDQHIAAERAHFERLMSTYESHHMLQGQQLLLPLQYPITPVLADRLHHVHDALETLGFRFEVNDHTVAFHQIPNLIPVQRRDAFIEPLLQHLEATEEVRLDITDLIATMACHSSIRAGDPLNAEQMGAVISQWKACQRPWTCPHGRPVSYPIPHKAIMGYFDRPSLPQSSS